ncbi:4-hydroxyphenylacetate 3-hydroxylase N-terminal domain-containing protein [Sporosarcina sp. FSL W7-1349]|uniref:4-hydroxyphenylacetate 3-hydroxylase family protein n=1 Tax=Sporosarcina sp. FSL W7-1349 TaxID=2921561 RepID=UPI0030F56024
MTEVRLDLRSPLTGSEYMESLKDGRNVYIYGEKVKDVTTHPAFRNSVRSVAKLYDALHDPAYQEKLTTETDTGSGGFTHKFFRASRSQQELVEARDSIAEWNRLSYGYMGRTPDFKATFLAGLGDTPEYFGEYRKNAEFWYKESQEKVWFFNHAIVNPPVDRNKPVHENDINIRAVKETDKGIVVNGAKMVATGSMLTNYTFVAQFQPVQKEEYALAFFVDMNAEGLKIISRPSYEMAAAKTGSPFDYPLSSRYDENDAILVFDNVLIPWENVIVYRDVEKSNNFLPATGYINRAMLQASTRMGVKLDFVSGLLMKAVEAAGTNTFRGVQAQVGEVLAWRQIFWSMSTAMISEPNISSGGVYLPNINVATTSRIMNAIAWPRVKDIIQQVVAGGLIVQPSSAEDFSHPDLRPYLDKFYRGSNGYDAVERNKLIKLLWDAMGSEFGSRHELYERNYSGNHEAVRMDVYNFANQSPLGDSLKEFVETCMNDYDLNGWKDSTWINNDDVSSKKF